MELQDLYSLEADGPQELKGDCASVEINSTTAILGHQWKLGGIAPSFKNH